MSAEEYRKALAALDWTQQGFARAVGADPRTGQKWALGETRIPGPVVILLRLLLARPELKAVVEGLTPPAPRQRARHSTRTR
jgi:hypothetical protein